MCCKTKKITKISENEKEKALISKNPPNKWLLWQSFFALKCFDDSIIQTRSINRVVAPYTLSVQFCCFLRASTGETQKFFEDVLRIKGFYYENDFENDLRESISLLPLDRLQPSKSCFVSTVDRIFIDGNLKIKEEWTKFVDENASTLKIKTIGSNRTSIQSNEFLVKELQEACGGNFSTTDPSTLRNPNAKLLAIAGTRIRAILIAETSIFKEAPFLMAYSIQQKHHPFFIAQGSFYHVSHENLEGWQIDLKPKESSSEHDSSKAEFSLVLIRPMFVGDILNVEAMDKFYQVAEVINLLKQSEPTDATLLLPYIDLPARNENQTTFGIMDLTTNWKEKNPEIVKGFSNVAESSDVELDKLYHCASFVLGPNGISFQGYVDPQGNGTLSKVVPSNTSKISERPSIRIQQLLDAKSEIPQELLIKKTKKEKVYHFSTRFDSPFLFFVTEQKVGSILLAGCYGGKPAVSKDELSKNLTQKQQNWKNIQKKKHKKCSIC